MLSFFEPLLIYFLTPQFFVNLNKFFNKCMNRTCFVQKVAWVCAPYVLYLSNKNLLIAARYSISAMADFVTLSPTVQTSANRKKLLDFACVPLEWNKYDWSVQKSFSILLYKYFSFCVMNRRLSFQRWKQPTDFP